MTTTSIIVGLGGGSAYKVNNSLRFRAAATATLTRTPSVAGNRQKWTWSGWVKLGGLTTTQVLFGAGQNATTGIDFGYQSTNTFFYSINGVGTFQTTALYRDPSAWYHVVFAFDSTQATQANRSILYVNGVNVQFSTNGVVQNNNYDVNNTITQYFGQSGVSTQYLDGYIAEVNFVDGQQLTASSFGTFDTNGVWQPINYSGTYGTNGFHLTFGNTSSVANLGLDSSGNGNTWTVNNISLTAGTTYDSMTDSPTVTSASVANYATFNPLWQSRTNSPTNGNLDYAASSVGIGTIGMSSGSYYWEITSTGGTTTAALYSATASSSIGVTTGLTYGFRFNATTGVFDYTTNGSLFTNIATGLTSGPYFPYVSTAAATTASFNAGQRPFSYTPPTGFNALNTYNLPTVTIPNGALYMAASTYTGTGATQTINDGTNNSINATFQPDFVWIKSRSAATDHALYDVVRGATLDLASNTTAAETTQATGLTAFGSTGFTIGALAKINTSAATYVGWQWKANGSGVSNTNGSITSTVSANTTAGFSIVSYTGTGANATVGHGLGAQPQLVIIKDRNDATNWAVNHVSIWSAGTGILYLNLTNAVSADATFWNSTNPTSSVIYLGTNASVNGSGKQNVAYCFAAVAGYSAFGSYTGNGSTDGPFAYVGFRPRYVMIKRTDSTGDWYIWDTSRNTYNVVGEELYADSSAAGSTATDLDILSNGFKIRTTTSAINASGGTFVYACFSENPFNSSRAR